ncbi:MAG: DNA translocase FtsK 4TM domain-containing protein [Planctomycetota bacterium]
MRTTHGADATEPIQITTWLTLVALSAVWVFAAASVFDYNAADAPSHTVWPTNDPAANWCGPAGAAVAHWSYRLFGWAVWAGMLGALALLAIRYAGHRLEHPIVRCVGLVFAMSGLAGLQAHAVPGSGPMAGIPGGTVGLTLATEIGARFGGLGTTFALALTTAIGLIVCFDKWLVVAPLWVSARTGVIRERSGLVGKAAAWVLDSVRAKADQLRQPRVRLDDLDADPDEEFTEAKRKKRAAERKRREKSKRIKETAGGLGATEDLEDDDVYDADDAAAAEYDEDGYEYEDEEGEYEEGEYDEEEEYEDEDAEVVADDDEYEDEEEDDETPGAPQVFSEDSIRDKVAKLPLRFAGANKSTATEEDLRDLQNVAELEGYRYPSIELLEDPDESFSETLEELVREQAEALESALQQYKIDGEVVGIESGPVITLYDVKLAPGTKVSKLTSIQSDLARSLKAVNIRIVANQAGRDTVGVEVPNPTKEKVRLKELMSSRERFQKMKLPMFLGKDASGEPLIEDLTKMPHMLIAGTTGSGKSVCMNTIIMSFLYTKKPNELKMVLVDPKMVEMSQFKDIPHLMCPVVTEMGKAAAILEWAVKKMDERYELLVEAGCRDITGYNDLDFDELCERMGVQSDDEKARIPQRLPYMVFIIDELADLMMTNKEVEGSIIRIAQKARAVGIHLILATQRPQANVVTGLIKGNMPCRVAFKVASGLDSRIVLDQKGGELLLGQGDMLYLSPRSHKLHRAQGTLVDDMEIRKVVKFMREVAGPTYERQLVQLRSGDSDEERIIESENNSSASLAAAQEDPMFDRAVEIVLETKRGSVSLLQRRLAIGYTRASRLIDLMGIAGIIGEHKGSVAREVAISIEEWEAMKAYNEQQMRAADGDNRSDDEYAADQERAKANYKTAQGTLTKPAPEADEAEAAIEEPPFETDDAEIDDAEELDEGEANEPEAPEEELEDAEADDDPEAEYEDEDAEYEEGDEGEDEAAEDDEEYDYVLVDEDGNEIDPEDAEDYEEIDEYEEDEEEIEEEPRAAAS